jgi:hypothetical protein
MLTPPDGLSEDVLASAILYHWGITVASMSYRPVGFGSHHWAVRDTEDTRWFVTADDLETKRYSRGEPLDAAFERLRAALAAATALRRHGRRFVVAPISTLDGGPLARANDRFGVALYPFVDGQSFEWGEFSEPARLAMLDLIITVHTAGSRCRYAMVDDFAIPHRDELEAALDPAGEVADCGPYARPAATLVSENAEAIRRLLARYDTLAAVGRAQPDRMVLTHGEPHPGNTMLTAAGWLLIDWDTAMLAPPERDLWSLDPGDGSILGAYADATGVSPLPSMLELYGIRWDLAELAVTMSGFRRHHTGSLDDDKSWTILCSLVRQVGCIDNGGHDGQPG